MRLRPMTMEDADKMLEWKNYPETRKFSIQSKAVIKKEDHYKWLEQNIQFFQIIEGPYRELCGAIRIKDKEVSIWIDQDYRNNGVATFFLREIIKPGMWATIAEGNIISMRIFIQAGLKPTKYENNYYIFK